MNADDIDGISMVDVRRDIYRGIVDCSSRGLVHAAKWLAELNHGLDMQAKPTPVTAGRSMLDLTGMETDAAAGKSSATAGPSTSAAQPPPPPSKPPPPSSTSAAAAAGAGPPLHTDAERIPPMTGCAADETDAYYVAKSFFDCREYSRAAHFTQHCRSPVPHFLHLYATYMAREKRRLDNMTDSSNLHQPATSTAEINDLLHDLRGLHAQRMLDGYGLYLYGIVLKRIDLPEAAVRVLCEAVRAVPTLWSAWIELAPLVMDRERLVRLQLPQHWMRHIFVAHCMVELFQNDEGLKMFEELQAVGFRRSTYITSQMAIAYHNKRSELNWVVGLLVGSSDDVCVFWSQMWTKRLRFSRIFRRLIRIGWRIWISTRICCLSRR